MAFPWRPKESHELRQAVTQQPSRFLEQRRQAERCKLLAVEPDRKIGTVAVVTSLGKTSKALLIDMNS